ncbi:hypothetical protein O3G_MSEX013089, partial [Manduca sexta]
GATQLGAPHKVERLGETFVPFQVFVDYLQGLATTTYTPGMYNLLEHNCNHFSDEVAQFLCGARVPKHVLSQPDELLDAPQRAALQGLLANLLPDSTNQVPPVCRRILRHLLDTDTLVKYDLIDESVACVW